MKSITIPLMPPIQPHSNAHIELFAELCERLFREDLCNCGYNSQVGNGTGQKLSVFVEFSLQLTKVSKKYLNLHDLQGKSNLDRVFCCFDSLHKVGHKGDNNNR